jgi:hypothetical protein
MTKAHPHLLALFLLSLVQSPTSSGTYLRTLNCGSVVNGYCAQGRDREGLLIQSGAIANIEVKFSDQLPSGTLGGTDAVITKSFSQGPSALHYTSVPPNAVNPTIEIVLNSNARWFYGDDFILYSGFEAGDTSDWDDVTGEIAPSLREKRRKEGVCSCASGSATAAGYGRGSLTPIGFNPNPAAFVSACRGCS